MNAMTQQDMLAAIEADARTTAALTGIARFDARILQALGKVPRAFFVPRPLKAFAHENRPLPIGCDQTISQPYMVALMTQLLAPEPEDRVLEIGTGSGYQAAILAELVAEVYSVEVIPKLAQRAQRRLARLGYDNVHCRVGDGYEGWPQAAPFDKIIVTAAPWEIPPPLIKQLRHGGRLVIPLESDWRQTLVLAIRRADGTLATHSILAVRFVPLVRPAHP